MSKGRRAAPEKVKPRPPVTRKPASKVKKPPSPPVAAATKVRVGKTYLSKAELEEFREMLVQKRRTLLGDLSGMEKQTASQQASGNLSTMPTHMADVGTDNFEHEFTLGLLESEQALLREIDEALKRIDDRTYGMCLGTGQVIPKARLKAKPWAKYTVEYARMLEKGLVRPGEPVLEQAEEPSEEAAPAEEEAEEAPEEEVEQPEE